jgi:hypothetical protein
VIRIKELTAHQLDAWVALCEGERIATQYPPDDSGRFWLEQGGYGSVKECPRFSVDWAAGGPVAHRKLLSFICLGENEWEARSFPRRPMQPSHVMRGSTPLEALMRCRVALNMGRAVPGKFPPHLFTP